MNYEHRNLWARFPGSGTRPAPLFLDGQDSLQGSRAPLVFDERENNPRTNDDTSLTRTPATRLRSLLVPVDGEQFSEHALPVALAIARRSGAEVQVVHVQCPLQSIHNFDTVSPDSGFSTFHKLRQQSYLNDLCQRLANASHVQVTPLFLQRPEVSPAICEMAGNGTDLVVMATHRRSPLGRCWFGSVGDSLMRQLAVPLLFVPGFNAPMDLTGSRLMHHVLIPLDGSERAEQVLDPAMALGALVGADHTLLRVIRSSADYFDTSTGIRWGATPSDPQRRHAWSYVRRLADQWAGPSLRVHPRLVPQLSNSLP